MGMYSGAGVCVLVCDGRSRGCGKEAFEVCSFFEGDRVIQGVTGAFNFA